MRVLSLFSGGGLGDYGLTLAGMEIVGQVEIDDYCQKILALRWPEVPKWRDIRDVKGKEIIKRCGRIDLVAGGFPCQAFSSASRGRIRQQSLWPEMLRIIKEIKPKWVLAENVPNARHGGFVLSASDVGAPHLRRRLWMVGNPDDKGKPISSFNAETSRMPKIDKTFWETNRPDLRVDDGSSFRMDRLKLLGNGQVVQVVQWIGERILQFDRMTPAGLPTLPKKRAEDE